MDAPRFTPVSRKDQNASPRRRGGVMRRKTHCAIGASSLALALTVSAQATFAQAVSGGFDHGRPNAVAASRGQALAAVPGAASAEVVRSYLRARGFSTATVDSLRQVGAHTSNSGL